LRKKLQRQRKKKEKHDCSQQDSSVDLNSSQKDKLSDIDNAEIDDVDIDIGQDPKAPEETKPKDLANFGKRGRKLDEQVMVKICDMGNGCWTYHHFTPEIQTRQYRSPEVIIGADYNTSADVWSFACTIFEMVTGDFLFEPRKGNNYDKDDDHLA